MRKFRYKKSHRVVEKLHMSGGGIFQLLLARLHMTCFIPFL